MSTRKSKAKRLDIDGSQYTYWISELPYNQEGAVPLKVIIRAEFGTRSVCTFSGLDNRQHWHDYPDRNAELVISITPQAVCDLVRHAHSLGWDPISVRSNVTIQIDNSSFMKLHKSEGYN